MHICVIKPKWVNFAETIAWFGIYMAIFFDKDQGPFLLTWFNLNPSMDK